MAASDGANFQPSGTAVQPATITFTPAPVPTRPDAPPEKEREARKEAKEEIQEQVVDSHRQTGQATVDPRRVAQLRARLVAKFELSERQATQVLRDYINDPNNLIANRTSEDVQAALRGETPQVATPPTEGVVPNGAADQARADAQGTDGRGLARMASRGGSGTAQPPPPPPGSPTPTPKGATPPTPPTVAATATPPPPPPPVPAGTRGTPGMATAGNPPTDGSTATPESPTPLLPEQPLVATATGLPASPSPVPGAPRRPEGMRGESRTLLGSSDPKGVGPSTETVDAFNTTVAKAQLLFRGGTMQVPVPIAPPRVANDTFVARTREPSKGGEGSEGEGEGRVGGSLDRSLALGMRRQFRDTAC